MPAGADQEIAPDLRALSRRWFEKVWNERRAAAIHELATPDCTAQLEGEEGALNLEAFESYWRAWLNAVPDLRVLVSFIITEGATAVVHWRATGTHLGAGLGIPPSGRRVDFSGVTVHEYEGGLIVRALDRWNRGELIASLMQVRMDELRAHARLTLREAQVALLMAERFTHAEIADQLGIKPNTARRHCERVLQKLGVRRRQDVAKALGKIPGSVLDRQHGSDMGAPTD